MLHHFLWVTQYIFNCGYSDHFVYLKKYRYILLILSWIVFLFHVCQQISSNREILTTYLHPERIFSNKERKYNERGKFFYGYFRPFRNGIVFEDFISGATVGVWFWISYLLINSEQYKNNKQVFMGTCRRCCLPYCSLRVCRID